MVALVELIQLQIKISVNIQQDLNHQHQLIVNGQIGKQVDYVLKPVMVDAKNTQDIKQYLKVMVDLVQVQMKNTLSVILEYAQVIEKL